MARERKGATAATNRAPIKDRRFYTAGAPDSREFSPGARGLRLGAIGNRGKRGTPTSTCYLINDRDSKFCASFQLTIEAVGIKTLKLPARSPDLNSFAERWVKSVKG